MTRVPDTVPIASGALSAEIALLGAELVRLHDASRADLLWSGDAAFWPGHAPLLFPIVGSLRNGQYRLGAKSYALPRHGFARRRRFELRDQADNSVTFGLAADADTLCAYPFAFDLEVAYRLRDAQLEVVATVANAGAAPMPASFGFHPAFRWPLPYGQARASHRIRFSNPEPAPLRRLSRDGLVDLTPRQTPVEGCDLLLRDALFADDVVIFDALSSQQVCYGAPAAPELEIAFAGMPHLGIWTRPGAGFICIEPWQGFSDPVGFDNDLWHKPGIVAVPAGASRQFCMRVTLR